MNAYLGEFIGTCMLVILGDGVVASCLLKKTKAENGGWLIIVLAWGLAVMLAIFAVGRISGAHLNPAVTIAFAFKGDFPQDKVLGYVLSQFAGGLVGAIIVWFHFLPHWKQTKDTDAKLAVFCTAPAIRNTFYNFMSEVVATSILVLGLLFIGANEFSKGLNPIVVGLLIVSIGLSLGSTTGFAINPARDLGPRIAHFLLPIGNKGKSDWAYSWIPVVGPIVGGLLGVYLYTTLFT